MKNNISTFLKGGKTVKEQERLAALLKDEHPADTAEEIESLDPLEGYQILQLLPILHQAQIFSYLEPSIQLDLLKLMNRRQIASLLTEMSSDDRADLFSHFSPEEQQVLLPGLAQAEREDIRRLAAYESGTVGAIMTSEYAVLSPNLSVSQALDKLRKEAPDKETIYHAYVIDEKYRLIGSISLKDLILAEPATKIESIMDTKVHPIDVNEDQELAAKQVAKYDFIALPVINGQNQLVGIVTHDDALDVLQEESTEDFHRMVTVGMLGESFRNVKVRILYNKRILWLVLLVFINFFSGAGIAYFENVIVAYISLVFFMPLLIDSSGNAGSQSATLVVRALATGEVTLKDWGAILFRELFVSICLGLTMALVVSLTGIYRGGVDVAAVVSLSMLFVIVAGSLIGAILPFTLSRLKIDPAIASTPLITSIMDILGIVIYFSIAKTLLAI